MASPTVISKSPRIHKHVDACSFPFRNDTGECIDTGTTITKGGLTGITNVPIGIGDCGQAQLLCGPVVGYRMYLEDPLTVDVCLGDAVYHPVSGQHLGVAIHGGTRGADRGLEGPAAAAGTSCIWFLGLKADGTASDDGGGDTTPLATTCVSYTGAEALPAAFPTADPATGTAITGAEVLLAPAAGSTMSVDGILSGMDKASLPDGYTIKVQNTGEGQITYPAQVTGNECVFGTDEYVCLKCVGGEWVWT